MYCSILANSHESLCVIDKRLLEMYGLRIEKVEYKEFFNQLNRAWNNYGTERHQDMYNRWCSILSNQDFRVSFHGYWIVIHNIDPIFKTYPFRLQYFCNAVQLLYGIPCCTRYSVKIEQVTDEVPVGLSFSDNLTCPIIVDQFGILLDQDQSFVDQFIKNSTNFDMHKYIKLAYALYSSSFRLYNEKVPSYLMLMSSMETIFNGNPNQIANTMSRHVSLLLSDNKEKFKTHYDAMKKLYKDRNEVIHGISDPYIVINEERHKSLMDYARRCIVGALSKNLSKENLFDELNVAGFSS